MRSRLLQPDCASVWAPRNLAFLLFPIYSQKVKSALITSVLGTAGGRDEASRKGGRPRSCQLPGNNRALLNRGGALQASGLGAGPAGSGGRRRPGEVRTETPTEAQETLFSTVGNHVRLFLILILEINTPSLPLPTPH